jgi:hypothetical protein
MTGYAATPWPAEDGGPRRQQRPHGIPGPQAGGGELVAVRQAPISVMVLHGVGGELLLLRNSIGPDGVSWVESIHPHTLDEQHRSPDLTLGPYWPGGMGVLDDGSVVVVQGRWAHRLARDLTIAARHELPVEAPHNSFVLLGDGTLATKDLQRPGGPPSTLSLLDPRTLEPVADPVALHEPSVARLGADGDELVVVGIDSMLRYRWHPDRAVLEPADDPVRYRTRDDQSFGWDPVVDAGAIWWLDNGDHRFTEGLTMLGNGVSPGPVRLWKAPLDGGELASVEVCGATGGAVTNPPLVDPERGLVLGYDSANGVLAAFRTDDLAPRWQRPLHTSQHLWLYPDTGEVVANDHRPDEGGDALVVIDIATGDLRVRVPVESPAQSVVFGAPGTHRDAYYVSLSTIARVRFVDGSDDLRW